MGFEERKYVLVEALILKCPVPDDLRAWIFVGPQTGGYKWIVGVVRPCWILLYVSNCVSKGIAKVE
jgi:hypothetical protein